MQTSIRIVLLAILAGFMLPAAAARAADEARYVEEYKDPVNEEMKKALAERKKKAQAETDAIREGQKAEAAQKPALEFQMDVSGIEKPISPDQFQPPFHFPPVSQDRTGGCWCFTGMSFLESEVHRLTGEKVRLSEMYVIYHEYLEKARRLVRERGESRVSLGSEVNAGPRMMSLYGIVPQEAYPGLVGTDRHEHGPLLNELEAYLDMIKENDLWDEEQALAHVRIILAKHLGEPPREVDYKGRKLTPMAYMRDMLQLNPDDYVVAMSTLSAPFHTRAILDVPDNWWKSAEYLNLPLDEWFDAIKGAVAKGFTVGICGDTSEPGYVGQEDVAVVPDFDIPADRIDQNAREMRIANGSTSDDHCIHLLASLRLGDHDWFLIKDSSRSPHPGKFWGYMFHREDYVKLKMLSYIVHKDALTGLLEKGEAGR